ncbi:HEAT repeat domain-containing protein [Gloeocapsa sp. PCC 73106]|uniref:HEAT repeat domain-containing protein n=1 Tax=Gloeocapsa sp. PCC 73106 TaxID=102232 RepID=UPI0002AC8997|nr:HEAT repeat domain-containing protein [Gloeocapsa sp. PCC 73106]ELR97458.1 PBS lyase HEAT-like repeat protein [Gloeocapsa sp. PCC 73106]
MDKRFSSIYNLTEAEAIAILDTPEEELSENDSRYIAAAHLVNFPTTSAINALMRGVLRQGDTMANRIVRRKSVESLGRLRAREALALIRTCLKDEDTYLVENAVWAIAEIGTSDQEILEDVAKLLEKPGQNSRVIIHTLTNLHYVPAQERIRQFVDDLDPNTASAAIAAVCLFTGDYAQINKVVNTLQHPNVFARRLSIQDLINIRYYDAIPQIARCPVSLVFRLRGIRMLAEAGISAGAISFETIQPHLEQTLRDHPNDLNLVHRYEQTPDLQTLIRTLSETDFGRCYLACKTILECYPNSAPEELLRVYNQEADNDYGLHFHLIKLFGWLRYAPAYDVIIEALDNREPQFQKSRAAAAIALGELGDRRAIPVLKACLESKIWDLKYAALMALEQLGEVSDRELAASDEDWLIRKKVSVNL